MATARARQTVSDPAMPPVRRLDLPAEGPEDVVVDQDGQVYAGVAGGRVLRVDPDTGAVETVGNTGGRPLGLAICPDGSILVCDSRRGLLRMDGADVTVLVDQVDGERLNFASNVVRAEDGTIYFTASTRRFDLEHYRGDLLEHSGTGRLFRRDPSGEVHTLLDGLQFANGVVLAPDGSCVVVAETGGYRVTRYWLTGPKAGTAEPFVENLPGFPDNMSLGSDGLLWVSLASPRNPLLDMLLPLPGVLRQLLWLLPEPLLPKPIRTTWVMAFDFAGTQVHDLQSDTADYSMVTSVAEHAGRIYMGSLQERAIAVTTVPGSP